MHLKSKLAIPSLLIATLVLAFQPLPASSQTSAPPSTMETLNKEAQASDPGGVHGYSQHLIQILVGDSRDSVLVASLTDRLQRAELIARQGKRRLISEADIAQAFNEFMRETGAPNTLTANVGSVHSNRIGFERALPSVISQKANGSLCNPGEAVWVVSMLIANIGQPAAPPSQSENEPHFGAGPRPPVQRHLEIFFAGHSPSEAADVLDHLFNHLRI